ncbi:replicative DNA helicase [Streptacidiphilus sp. 4-A2]|nr:replicative DNA helicase [Streptacidiphilus sp. 4-A2]
MTLPTHVPEQQGEPIDWTDAEAAPGPARDRSMDRVPPQDLAAEQAVLGGMLLSKEAIADVVAVLKPSDYYRPAHETIHRAVLDLYTSGEPADPITVASELTKRGEIVKVGGPSYLHTLVNTVPTAANAEYYADIVHELAVTRRLAEAGTRIAAMAYAGEGEAKELVAKAQAELATVDDARAEEQIIRMRDSIGGTLELMEALGNRKEGLHGVPTGFRDLDALTNGLQAGQLIIIAARPALGKSTLALDIVRSASIHHGIPSVFFSLEMGRDELTMRALSAEARVGLHKIRTGTLTDDDWNALAKAAPRVTDAPMYIDDSTQMSSLDIRAKARRQQQRHGLGLVVVDYMQLMQAGGRRAESRQAEVSEISRNLKLLAKELAVPVVALSQLNRGPEQRTDKRPLISDLRESGSLEQDADMVILLHREDAYEKESPRAGEADLIVAKHRNGPTATISVAFAGHYSKFQDMATAA